MSLNVGEMFAMLKLDTKGFDGPMSKATGALSSLGGSVATAAAAGIAAIGAALLTVGVASGKMAMDFQKDMKNVQTLLGKDATEKVKGYGAEVKKLAQDTGKDLSDMSDGLYQVISAWGDSGDAVKQLEISAKASAAGLATTTDAVNLLSAHTKGYGDTSAAAVQKAADLAFMTANLGQTTFPELAASMGKVIPLAATLKVKEEDLYGAMATLTGVTGNTAEVTTQLRATMQALLDPSKDMGTAITNAGYASGEAMIKALGLQGTLDLLAKSTGGNTQELSNMFGSVEALNAVLALTGNQSADFTAKTEAMRKASGAASDAFEIQQQSVSAMLDRLKQTGTVMMVELGEKFLPMLETLAKWVMDYMPQIKAVFETAFDAIGKAISWLSENVLPLFQGAFSNSSGKAAEAMQLFQDKVLPVLKQVWDVISKFVEAVQLIWAEWGDEIMAINRVLFETVWTIISGALSVISGALDVFIGLFTGDWRRMGEGLLAIWDGLWKAINGLMGGMWEVLAITLGGLWGSLKKWFVDLAKDAYGWGVNVMKGMWDGLKSWFSHILDGLQDFANGIADTVKDALGIHSPSKVFAEIGANVGKGMAKGILSTEDLVARAMQGITPAAGGSPDWINRLANTADIRPHWSESAGAGGAASVQDMAQQVAAMLGGGSQTAGAGAPTYITVQSVLDGRVVAESTIKHMVPILRPIVRSM